MGSGELDDLALQYRRAAVSVQLDPLPRLMP
jgi:hypothetical protein